MGTIEARKRSDGTTGYTARVRIMRDGKTYKEAQTFDLKAAAKAWMKRREGELVAPGALERKLGEDPVLGVAIGRYIEESEKELGRTKKQVLQAITDSDLGQQQCSKVTTSAIVQYLQTLDVTPATRSNYLSHLAAVFAVARPMWTYPLDEKQIADAWTVTRKMGIIGKSRKRERRPTLEELDKLMEHFRQRNVRMPSANPMHYIIAFAIFATRREEEICRIKWADYEKDAARVMVRDMKNPGDTVGNDVRCDLVPEAIAIIEAVPRVTPEIFPYSSTAVSAAFTRACYLLGINTEDMPHSERLHFHDLRHEGVSRLFEMGWNIPHVAGVSGHRSWNSLKRYTHLRQTGDKYKDWKWMPVVTTPLEREPDPLHRSRSLRRDMPRIRGRVMRGEDQPLAKLNPAIVRAIRASGETISALSRKHGVSRTLIRAVKEKKVWQHVTS